RASRRQAGRETLIAGIGAGATTRGCGGAPNRSKKEGRKAKAPQAWATGGRSVSGRRCLNSLIATGERGQPLAASRIRQGRLRRRGKRRQRRLFSTGQSPQRTNPIRWPDRVKGYSPPI